MTSLLVDCILEKLNKNTNVLEKRIKTNHARITVSKKEFVKNSDGDQIRRIGTRSSLSGSPYFALEIPFSSKIIQFEVLYFLFIVCCRVTICILIQTICLNI